MRHKLGSEKSIDQFLEGAIDISHVQKKCIRIRENVSIFYVQKKLYTHTAKCETNYFEYEIISSE